MPKKTAAQLDREIAEALAGASGAHSVYKELVAAGVPIDHHESDLYVLDTRVARGILAAHGKKGTPFTSQVDGKRWLDVPFAYEPFWEKKSRAHSTVVGTSSGKSKRVPKTRTIWVVQGNYGYGHGWEDVTAAETWKETKDYLRDYRANEPGVPFRAIRRRERINP